MSIPPFSRIIVVGPPGTGKSTLAKRLSDRFQLPYIELDSFRWGENWQTFDDATARLHIDKATDQELWVADGNAHMCRDIVWRKATHLIWLNYPRRLILPRLFGRTLRYRLTNHRFTNGNRESLRKAFLSRRSIFIKALKRHHEQKYYFPIAFSQPEYAHLEVLRFTHPKQMEAWLNTHSQLTEK